MPDVERAAERRSETEVACFERAATAFLADCKTRGKRPVLKWFVAQFAEWEAPAASTAASADEQRAEARQRAAARAHDEFMRGVAKDLRKQASESGARKIVSVAPSAATPASGIPKATKPIPEGHRLLREAQRELKQARDQGAPEGELVRLKELVKQRAHDAVAEARAARGEVPR